MSDKRPNILIVLADDMGYSDLGCYGSEIRTPNIDRLAAEGLRFSDYHTSSLCSPTRAMLLSGTDCHLAGLGIMSESAADNPEFAGKPGFEGYLNRDVVAISELLQEAGYFTAISGKWHLGYNFDAIPSRRGFDESSVLLPGASNHFAWAPDWGQAGLDGVPTIGSINEMLFINGDQRWEPEPNTTEDPHGFYSSYTFADNLIEFIKASKSKTSDGRKPFFAYLPFSAPHQPIHCFPEDRDHYKGIYDSGPEALRQQRLKNLADLGFIDPKVIPHDVMTKGPFWEKMDPEERKQNARSYECYAGMVEGLDRATGRVVDYLREIGELDNTLVMMFSDNGPEGANCELQPLIEPGGNLKSTIAKFYDNSYENAGNFNSFVQPGAEWAQASTAPNRLYKHVTTEGGIRVPLVVRYPPFNKHHAPGSVTHAFSTVMDVMPTVLSLAGVQHPNAHPKDRRDKAKWKDYMVYPMRGRDWIPYLLEGKAAEPTLVEDGGASTNGAVTGRKKLFSRPSEDEAIWGKDSEPVGWEMGGKASVRRGKWKIVNLPPVFWGTGRWQLYDLEEDQGETHDLAEERPDKLKEMLGYWEQYQAETGAYLLREHPARQQELEEKRREQAKGERRHPRPGQKVWMKVDIGKTLPHGARAF